VVCRRRFHFVIGESEFLKEPFSLFTYPISLLSYPMSRRAKLLITALFLMLLAIPAAYITLTWRPANPLRFRQLDEKVENYASFFAPGDPAGQVSHGNMLMEVRNTSLVTVRFMGAWFTAESSEGKGTFFADDEWSEPRVSLDEYYIPPGGSIQIELSGSALTAEDLKLLQAGMLPSRKGTMVYQWGSHVHVFASSACYWLRKQLPESLRELMPEMDPFQDVIDVDITPPPSADQSQAINHKS
jgi:hypothetical protein